MRRLLSVMLFGVASCQSAPTTELTDSERAAVTAEIEQEAEIYLEALMGRDIDRWSSLFRRDGFEMLLNGDLRESYEVVTSRFARTVAESWAGAEVSGITSVCECCVRMRQSFAG